MKDFNYYMNLSYRMEIIEDPDEGGYVVSFPDLPGCLTCGETISSAIENAKDAKAAWIDAALEMVILYLNLMNWISIPVNLKSVCQKACIVLWLNNHIKKESV